jgi:hypothetical protein
VDRENLTITLTFTDYRVISAVKLRCQQMKNVGHKMSLKYIRLSFGFFIFTCTTYSTELILLLSHYSIFLTLPIRVAARSKAFVCGRSLTGILGSNPAGGMDICLS